MMTARIGQVAIAANIDQTFDYLIPERLQSQATVGQRVRVSFRHQEAEGFLVGFKEESEYTGKLAEILEPIDPEPVISEQGLKLARWLAEYYVCPLGLVLKALAPASLKRRDAARYVKYVHLKADLTEILSVIEELSRRLPRQAAILKTLLSLSSPPTQQELLKTLNCSEAPLKSLEAKGLISIEKRPIKGAPKLTFQEEAAEVLLTREQQAAASAIKEALADSGKMFLLHGVNNSGKTEVYLQAAKYALELGKQAIMVVPEISLTPQLVARFRSRFSDQIALYHSGLTDAERAREFWRIQNGEASVAIGVRAAIFAPFENLGLIIIDEEHEHTYKQEDLSPLYHVREVALKRAELEGATVVMGTATPSLESYYQALKGKFKLLELTERAIGGSPPQTKTINMGAERDELISSLLKQKISQRLKSGEQIILLLNRLGFSTCVVCRRCRASLKCPRCRITLVYHFKEQRLRCHYCAYAVRATRCRKCGSSELKFLGAGTEKLELHLKRLFPQASLRRMDSEIVRRGQHAAILEEFRQGRIQIFLGTQMIGLGLDFPNVTLVGVISADTLLDMPDFRAGERTFQLISQAAGRAGRGRIKGEVIVQTHHPEHYAIKFALKQDYRGFYEQEIRYRAELNYPPFSHLISLVVEGSNENKTAEDAQKLKRVLQSLKDAEILGPSQVLPHRVRGLYRQKLILKTSKSVHQELKAVLQETGLSRKVKIDVDPL